MKLNPALQKKSYSAFNGGWESRAVSWLLAGGAALFYLVVFFALADWQHEVIMARDCVTPSYRTAITPWCEDARGWAGWGEAACKAFPLAAAMMLIVIGLVYRLFGDRLGLELNGIRRDVMMLLSLVSGGVATLILISVGFIELYV